MISKNVCSKSYLGWNYIKNSKTKLFFMQNYQVALSKLVEIL